MKPPTLVALRALKVGDVVTAVPALRALARAFPLHRRILAAPIGLRSLAWLSRAVDDVVDTAPLAPLPSALARPAIAVNLHGKGPQSTRLLAAAGPGRLVTFACADARESRGGPAWRDDEHEVARWCRLLTESGIPADPTDLRLATPPVLPPPASVGATIVHPGASAAARRWPADRFAAVARAERRAGRRVVITGDPSECDLARHVARLAGVGDEDVLAGRTSLLELAAAVAHSARVCSGDTGVAHLATAFGTPSVVLFGPVSPAAWGPPPGDTRHRALWHGRTGDPHAPRVDQGLRAITVDEVVAALHALPEVHRAAPRVREPHAEGTDPAVARR